MARWETFTGLTLVEIEERGWEMWRCTDRDDECWHCGTASMRGGGRDHYRYKLVHRKASKTIHYEGVFCGEQCWYRYHISSMYPER